MHKVLKRKYYDLCFLDSISKFCLGTPILKENWLDLIKQIGYIQSNEWRQVILTLENIEYYSTVVRNLYKISNIVSTNIKQIIYLKSIFHYKESSIKIIKHKISSKINTLNEIYFDQTDKPIIISYELLFQNSTCTIAQQLINSAVITYKSFYNM